MNTREGSELYVRFFILRYELDSEETELCKSLPYMDNLPPENFWSEGFGSTNLIYILGEICELINYAGGIFSSNEVPTITD